ncbi:TetR/AcrR family transcriptional regulator [Nocardia takedensis]
MTAPRAERRRRRTQRRFLVSARRLFLIHGYAATPVTQIAAGAGYTTGPLGKHYPYKHLLGHEVAEGLTALALHRLRSARPTDHSDLVTTLSHWARIVIGHSGWLWFEIELATTSPEHRDRHHDRTQRIHTALTDLLTETIEPAPGSDLTTTAAALLATLTGFTVAPVGNAIPDHQQVRARIELILRTVTAPAFPATTDPHQEDRPMSHPARTTHDSDDIAPAPTDGDHALAITTPPDDDSDVITAVRVGLQAVRDD